MLKNGDGSDAKGSIYIEKETRLYWVKCCVIYLAEHSKAEEEHSESQMA